MTDDADRLGSAKEHLENGLGSAKKVLSDVAAQAQAGISQLIEDEDSDEESSQVCDIDLGKHHIGGTAI